MAAVAIVTTLEQPRRRLAAEQERLAVFRCDPFDVGQPLHRQWEKRIRVVLFVATANGSDRRGRRARQYFHLNVALTNNTGNK